MSNKELKEHAANLYFYIQLTKDYTILKQMENKTNDKQ